MAYCPRKETDIALQSNTVKEQDNSMKSCLILYFTISAQDRVILPLASIARAMRLNDPLPWIARELAPIKMEFLAGAC